MDEQSPGLREPDAIARIREMRTKLFAIVVVGILAMSIIATAVAAIGQVTGEESRQTAYASRTTGADDDGSFNSAFKFVCPFH